MVFRLPRLVVSRTSGDEFHSLNATPMRCDRSHWLNRDSCVDLPEPSMPSTTTSLPRWRFGTRRGIDAGAPYYNDCPRTTLLYVDLHGGRPGSRRQRLGVKPKRADHVHLACSGLLRQKKIELIEARN